MPKKGLTVIHWVGIVVGLGIVGLVLAFALSGEDPEKTKEERELADAKAALKKGLAAEAAKKKISAYNTCVEHVKQKLTYPKTARFPSATDPNWVQISQFTKGNMFHVISKVDTQDANGRTVRFLFACRLKVDGASWDLVYIKMNQTR